MLFRSYTIIPKFEYRWRSFIFDGAYSASVSRNTYGALRNGMAGNAQVNALGSLTVVATRPGINSSAWQVVQTGGQDWTNLAAYAFPRLTDDVRYVYNEVSNATLNGKWTAPFRWPTFLKFGAKRQERITNADNKGTLFNYNYVGPGGGPTGNIPRVVPSGLEVHIDARKWPRLPVFDWLQRAGNVERDEMYRTFNCGLGMVVVVAADDAAQASAELRAAGETVWTIGSIDIRRAGEAQTVVA